MAKKEKDSLVKVVKESPAQEKSLLEKAKDLLVEYKLTVLCVVASVGLVLLLVLC